MSVIPKPEPTKRKTKPAELPKPAKAKVRLEGAAGYGAYYWCVKTDLAGDGEIYVFADVVRYQDGAVLFLRLRDDGTEQSNLALAAGQWTAVFAAGCLDGQAVAVEHWKGEIAR